MAKMEDLINDVLTELRYASGRDVQIHAQDYIGKKIAQLYRTMMKQYKFRDYISTYELTTSNTGAVATPTNYITKFSDIVSVYRDRDIKPLPVAMAGTNTKSIRTPTLVSVGGAAIFRIYPQKEYPITLIAKNIVHDDFTIDDDVPFYRDLLVLGTAASLASVSGVNDEHKELLMSQFNRLIDTYVTGEMQETYATPNSIGGLPEQWFIDD